MPTIWDTSNPEKPTATVDIDSINDYSRNFADYLTDSNNDTISTIEILPQIPEEGSPPDVVSSGHLNGIVTAFLDFSPCTVGVKQIVTYRINTVGGRREDRSFYFKLKQR